MNISIVIWSNSTMISKLVLCICFKLLYCVYTHTHNIVNIVNIVFFSHQGRESKGIWCILKGNLI